MEKGMKKELKKDMKKGMKKEMKKGRSELTCEVVLVNQPLLLNFLSFQRNW